MIPHRMLSNEINGSGLKNRVTACRKRLRISRVTHRASALNDAHELFSESAPAVSEVHTSTMHLHHLSGYGVSDDRDALLLLEEQEVGIT
jgi:hypothetical protein